MQLHNFTHLKVLYVSLGVTYLNDHIIFYLFFISQLLNNGWVCMHRCTHTNMCVTLV
uniref:Uncharacterized protein n=1 Tax=Rhizophora mucronata TaxID=61149 RepID=A0A2P2QLR5_RHIMU